MWGDRLQLLYSGDEQPWSVRVSGWVSMITPVECRQRAVECRQMADRAPNLRVRSILTDMAWTGSSLALAAEQLNPTSERLLKPLGPGSPPSPPPRDRG
jgi:hypothetical protein